MELAGVQKHQWGNEGFTSSGLRVRRLISWEIIIMPLGFNSTFYLGSTTPQRLLPGQDLACNKGKKKMLP